MRSKEVEDAIDYLSKYIKWETYGERHLESDIETVLSYISELEKENIEYKTYIQKLDKLNASEFIFKDTIRDKIKELEEQDELYKGYKGLEFSRTGVINLQIRVLKELLEN